MKKLIRLVLIIALGVAFSSTNFTHTTAQQNQADDINKGSGQAANPWYTEYVHQAEDYVHLGQNPSLIFHLKYGYPEIFYYYPYTTDLYEARRISGDCPGSSSWDCYFAGGYMSDAGEYSSADTWHDVDHWQYAVSFRDSTKNALDLTFNSVDQYGMGFGYTVWIDQVDIALGEAGYYTSVKFYPDGEIGVAYTIVHPDYNEFKYAHSVDGGGNCGLDYYAGKWDCEFIYIGGLGNYTSLDITWDNIPVVSTYDSVYGDLWVAYYVGSGGLCGAWECVYIDGAGDVDVGRSTSISAPQQPGDPVRIAYYDYTNSKLKFYNSDWGISMFVDDVVLGPQPGLSMDIDQEGYPVIAYQKHGLPNNPEMLGIARPYLVYNDGEYGNCGDPLPGLGQQYWRCTTIAAGDYYHLLADYVSVRVNSNNIVGIAYTEYDEMNNSTSLKFASQYNLTYLPVLLKP